MWMGISKYYDILTKYCEVSCAYHYILQGSRVGLAWLGLVFQIHPYPFRSTQIQPDLFKCIQITQIPPDPPIPAHIHPDPPRSIQNHPNPPRPNQNNQDPSRSTQLHADPTRSTQIHPDPPRSTQILSDPPRPD